MQNPLPKGLSPRGNPLPRPPCPRARLYAPGTGVRGHPRPGSPKPHEGQPPKAVKGLVLPLHPPSWRCWGARTSPPPPDGAELGHPEVKAGKASRGLFDGPLILRRTTYTGTSPRGPTSPQEPPATPLSKWNPFVCYLIVPIHRLCNAPCPTPSLSLLTPGSCCGRYPRQASATSQPGPSAASGHPGGAGGDGQRVRLGGPRGWLGRWAGLAAGRLTPVCGR